MVHGHNRVLFSHKEENMPSVGKYTELETRKRGFTVSQMIPESTVLGLTLFSRLSVLILHKNRRQTAGRRGDEGTEREEGTWSKRMFREYERHHETCFIQWLHGNLQLLFKRPI